MSRIARGHFDACKELVISPPNLPFSFVFGNVFASFGHREQWYPPTGNFLQAGGDATDQYSSQIRNQELNKAILLRLIINPRLYRSHSLGQELLRVYRLHRVFTDAYTIHCNLANMITRIYGWRVFATVAFTERLPHSTLAPMLAGFQQLY